MARWKTRKKINVREDPFGFKSKSKENNKCFNYKKERHYVTKCIKYKEKKTRRLLF